MKQEKEMTRKKQFGTLDGFRLTGAFLVVAIHSSPFASFSADMDFIFTRIFARMAVPFFLMMTGYFLLPQYLFRHCMDKRPLIRALQKHLLLYLAAVLLYLPVNLYAGQFEGLSADGIFRMFFTDGTFYHLWYLPAAFSGILIVWFLATCLSFGMVAGITVVLYVVGLFGDSCYGLTMQIPFLKKAYDVIFTVSSYTRNGFFYAPLFLVMGAGIHGGGYSGRTPEKKGCRKNAGKEAAGFTVLFALMIVEGIILHRLNLQRHDSMYLMLPAVMFFLFRLLLSGEYGQKKRLREISLWIYLLHPYCIILVRGTAKELHLINLLVDNSLLHYLAVCTVSLAAAVIAAGWADRGRKCLSVLRGRDQICTKGRAWIELSRENLRKNVGILRRMLLQGEAADGSILAVVKANAYGHGAALIAKELQGMGIDTFAVACISEGVELRKNGITGDILILGYTHPRDFPVLQKYRLVQTVVDCDYGTVLNRYSSRSGKIGVHVKIDTGMHRLGERSERMEEIDRIFRLKNLKVEGVYTHLCADETRGVEDMAFTRRQAELFYEDIEKLKKRGHTGLKVHLLASYGLVNYPELGGDYVRAGIALYGLLSDRKSVAGRKDMAELVPVLSLKARIAVVKDLYQGESAVLLGRCGDKEITAYEWADAAGTITNEILSRLGARLPRIIEE